MSKANNKIEIGDTVRIRWPEKLKKQTAGTLTYVVQGKPGNNVMDDKWWTLLGNTGALFIVTELIVLEILN